MKNAWILIILAVLIAGCTTNQEVELDESESETQEADVGSDSVVVEEEGWPQLEGLTDFNLVTTAYDSARTNIELAVEACSRVEEEFYRTTCYQTLPKAIFSGTSYAYLLQLSQASSLQVEALFEFCTNQLPDGVDFSNFNGNTGVAGCLDVIVDVPTLVPLYVEALGRNKVETEFCNAEGMNQVRECFAVLE